MIDRKFILNYMASYFHAAKPVFFSFFWLYTMLHSYLEHIVTVFLFFVFGKLWLAFLFISYLTNFTGGHRVILNVKLFSRSVFLSLIMVRVNPNFSLYPFWTLSINIRDSQSSVRVIQSANQNWSCISSRISPTTLDRVPKHCILF